MIVEKGEERNKHYQTNDCNGDKSPKKGRSLDAKRIQDNI